MFSQETLIHLVIMIVVFNDRCAETLFSKDWSLHIIWWDHACVFVFYVTYLLTGLSKGKNVGVG